MNRDGDNRPTATVASKRLRAAITILPITLLLIGMIVFSFLSWQSALRETSVELRALGRTQAVSLGQIFSSLEATLLIIGERLVEAGALDEPERGRDIINRLIGSNGSLVAFGLARLDGQLVLVNGISAGQPLPNLLASDLTAASFEAARSGGGRMIPGRTYYMETLGEWVLPVRTAIVDAKGAPIAVMTAGVRIADIKERWALDAQDAFTVSLMTFDGHWQIPPDDVDPATSPSIGSTLAAAAVERLRGNDHLHDSFSSNDPSITEGILLEDLDMVLWASAAPATTLNHFLSHFRVGLALLAVGTIAILGLLFGGRKLLTQYEAALLRQAYVDDLTGLPNRAVIVDRVEQLVEVCRRQEWHMAYIMLDIDHFKRINDVRGHGVGDRVLTRLGRRLRARLPAEVTVARVGGDEFSVFFASPELNQVRARLAEILELVRDPIDTREGHMHVTASMGVAIYPDDGDDPAELHRKADTALYQAKAYGRDRWTLFSSDLDVSVSREIQLIDRLREALAENRVAAHYQPIVNARTAAMDAVEVLARWNDEQLGTVSPAEFIPVAESAHLIDRLTERVIEHAARDLVDATGTNGAPLGISVNVSAVQLADPDFARWFGQTCSRVGLKLTRITVELTESALIEAADEATLQIRMLRAAGCRVVLDDFGTGYSSIAYLRRMPLDAIKIDRQFVATVDQEGSIDLGLVQGILSMATPMGLDVVAEGIERESQADALRTMGAEWFQGHYFSPPVDAPTLAGVIGGSTITAGD